MDESIFKKLKLKPGSQAFVVNAPEEYPTTPNATWQQEGASDFVHLFVKSKAEFESLFQKAASSTKDDGIFWISYPKSTKKETYDINRDSLWDIVTPLGWHPVSQVSLGDTWSAIRLKRNEEGTEYTRPNAR